MISASGVADTVNEISSPLENTNSYDLDLCNHEDVQSIDENMRRLVEVENYRNCRDSPVKTRQRRQRYVISSLAGTVLLLYTY